MLNISVKNKAWLDALLSEDLSSTEKALKKLPASTPDSIALSALALIAHLHQEESIRNKALTVLKSFWNEQQLQEIAAGLEIFTTISTLLPWMGEENKAVQFEKFGLFRQFQLELNPLLASYPIYTELYLDLGRKLYMLFELEEEAKSCFEGIVAYSPQNDEAQYALGRIYEHNELYDLALEAYTKSIESNLNNTYAQLQIGNLKATIYGLYQEAIEHYNKVVEIDPYTAEPYIRVAEAYYHLKEYARCKQFLEIALGVNEYQEEALNLLGILQWKVEGNYEKASATFQKGVDHKIHGDSALLLASLGDLHAQYLQDMDKARLYYSKSLMVNPAQKEVIQQFVPILLNSFQDQAAVIQCYEDYLRLKPKDAEIAYQFAAFLVEQLRDHDYAYQQLQVALEVNPEFLPAQKLMRQIQSYVNVQEELVPPPVEPVDLEEFELPDPEDYEILYSIDEEEEDDDDDDDDFAGGGAAGDN